MRLHLLPLLPLALAAASGAHAQIQTLSISNPWIRFITPNTPAGGYFTVTNAGSKPVVIMGASSPACGSVMLHQSHESGGVSSMDMVSQVTVPAHGGVTFRPGGYHLMCMSPTADMRVGTTVPVTIQFQDNRRITKPFTVRGPTGK